MAPIQINLSAPIYPSDGTSVVPNKANERIEASGEILVSLRQALDRKRRDSGQHGAAMRAMFGDDQYEFIGELPVGYTHVRGDSDGRRDIKIYGHPSGHHYVSAAQFMPHVVAMLVFSDRCYCNFCR